MKRNASAFRLAIEKIFSRLGLGMRAKLITLFVIIKVVPLILLAYVAWQQSWKMAEDMRTSTEELTRTLDSALVRTGEVAVSDAVAALDSQATREIERTSTDIARRVADFLYARDADITFISKFPPDSNIYRAFVENIQGKRIRQGQWKLSPDSTHWVSTSIASQYLPVTSSNKENETSFNYRPPDGFEYENKPLYLEITFIDTNGQELLKSTTSARMDPQMKNVSRRENTYIGAETYFEELKKLRPGEIYVSDVIGAYVGSRVIGMYTPESAARAGEEFSPARSAYAGMENPLGKRFEGLVRWGTPVVQSGRVIGYVTLALDHDHLMEFTAHIKPTQDRYTEIPDATEGNYAFIWDHKGRSIVHPRHFSIAGYDPQTGDPQVPWLEESIYDAWQASGLSYAEFIQDVPVFDGQSHKKKPAQELTDQGLVGLDCRYLNFAPQCTGWFDLTKDGGSGSFVIEWSGLKKLNTAAAIPYYTGQYGNTLRGFGFVAIGTGVDDFHRPAAETKKVLDALIRDSDRDLEIITESTLASITDNILETTTRLTVFTAVMVILVILVAIWMASTFTNNITSMIEGIQRFRTGQRHFRFNAVIKDEIGLLADSFDDMADSLVASFDTPVIIIGMDKKIRYMNDLALARINTPLEDVLDRPYHEFSLTLENTIYCPITALEKEREAEVMYHSGTDAYYQDKAMYLTDKDGSITSYIITSTDVSEIANKQKRIEEQRALLDTIFTASPDLIWYKDLDGKYQAVNPRFASIAAKPPEELVGRSVGDILGPEFAAQTRTKELQAIAAGKPVYSEESILFADGHTEILDSVRTPVYDSRGHAISILGVARDVTRRVQIEQELRETQLSLKEAVEKANSASSSKSEFLARMSHEIRTPMNAIIGLANVIRRKLSLVNPQKEEIQQHIAQIETSSKHLLSLLNDVLDISKIEAGKMELTTEAFSMRRLVDSITPIIIPRCQEKGINFQLKYGNLTAASFVSDPLRLSQILINLLGNAVKFTPQNGTITFSVRELERSEDKAHIEFSIKDTGPGIHEDDFKRLFTPFEQLGGQVVLESGGTGLGLSISRSIARLLGGDIKVKSVYGEGSDFSCVLWLEETLDEPYCELPVANHTELTGKRVLLVDDVLINRLIVIDLLGSLGVHIDEAGNGEEAVRIFSQSAPGTYDVILMDIVMPIMDGHSASRAIRNLDHPDAKSIPIIAMTANAFREDIEKSIRAGMNSHVAKPIELDTLIQSMIQCLNLRESSGEDQ